MTADLVIPARQYAERGWPVLPLHTPNDGVCSCQKGANCTQPGKHPRTRNGLKDASLEPRQIASWWSRWPDANIGVLTGSASGLVVLDLDNKEGKRGCDNLARLASEAGPLPATLTAMTGSGQHMFFAHPGVGMKNSVSTLAVGVDVRGDGGYVVAAPSMHCNGARYCWKDDQEPLANLPVWLLTRMTENKESNRIMTSNETNAFTDSPLVEEGTRNETLYKLGCALRGQHAKDHTEISSVLLEFNASKCHPPLDAEEVARIVDSVCIHPAEQNTSKSGARQEQSPLYWFPFNTREWFANQSLAIMTAEQTGWYIRLKAFAWDAGGFLPNDHGTLWRLARARSEKAFSKNCELVLAEYIEVEVEGARKLKNAKMASHFADVLELWMKKKAAGDLSRSASAERFTAVAKNGQTEGRMAA